MIDGSNKWFVLAILVIVISALYYYSSTKFSILDNMETSGKQPEAGSSVAPPSVIQSPSVDSEPKAAASLDSASSNPIGSSYQSQPIANPSDLLPKDRNSEWAALNPITANDVQVPDLLSAGYHIGIDTIGQTLKNPSYDLRSDPIIEKKVVGPWNMSTIDPDLARVPLEVGYGSR